MNPNRRSKTTLAYLKKHGLPSDFPLTPHAKTGQWRTKIKGRTVNFGALSDPKAALDLYQRELHARMNDLPIPSEDDTTLGSILDRWSDFQVDRRNRDEIATKTCDDYLRVVDMLADHFGRDAAVLSLTPSAWGGFRKKLSSSTTSPTVLTRNVTVSKMIFRWADESALLKDRVRFGPTFKVAPRRDARLKRLKSKKRTLNASDIRALIEAADQPLQSMIFLGINCGMTQAEVSGLEWADIDLDAAVLDTIRHKTAVERVATLWPETVASLREIPQRGNTARVFTTRHGNAYVRQDVNKDGTFRARDNVAREFAKLVKRAGIKLPAGVGFGKLRHTFRTVADNVRDANAIRRVMGHEIGRDSVESAYTEGVEMVRLKAVTDHVRGWLLDNNRG